MPSSGFKPENSDKEIQNPQLIREKKSQKTLLMRKPDDWHVHLRDKGLLQTVLPYTSALNSRAIVMPNISPPVTTVAEALAYRSRILAALPETHHFQPLMTCYLTDTTVLSELEKGFNKGIFTAAKLYPAHATTNSEHGVTDIKKIHRILDLMQKIGMPLLVHGEATEAHIDIFDREAAFIDKVLIPLRENWPQLKIVFEHITTKEAAQYVLEGNNFLGATITPQHLLFNRNHMLVGGIHPHLYCLPILKRAKHQEALCQAIATGHPRFFAGSDSAPHTRTGKESACGCAGVFNAPTSIAAYATVFEKMDKLTLLEAFCAENGANFYGLPLNREKIRLIKQPWRVPETISTHEGEIIPFLAGETLLWKIEADFINDNV